MENPNVGKNTDVKPANAGEVINREGTVNGQDHNGAATVAPATKAQP